MIIILFSYRSIMLLMKICEDLNKPELTIKDIFQNSLGT